MEIKTQLSRLGLFDARVPRYTSYPTAMHFKDTVGSAHYLEWVKQLTPGTPVSLYLHVPFCRRLCWFCACRTQGVGNMDPVRAYLDTLLTEVAMLRDALPQGVKGRAHPLGRRHANPA
jgi:oxygen-independent coproporphyrinogen-3 oxidase